MTPLLVLAALLQTPAAPALDTTLTVEGILVPVPPSGVYPDTWAVQLLSPLTTGPLRTNVVELVGNPGRWRRYADRYVTAAGRLTAQAGGRFAARMQVDRVTETTPLGLVERRVRISHSQSAIARLAVIPNTVRVSRPDSLATTQARPAVLYTVTNIGNTDLEFYFPSSKAVCVSVEPSRGPPWEDPTELRPGVAATVVIRMGLGFRHIVPLPPAATPVPGLYTVRVSLCGVLEYELTTRLEVVG